MTSGVHSMNIKINKANLQENCTMIIQKINETRLQYLSRCLDVYMDTSGGNSIEFDKVTCDGYCLAESIHNEIAKYDGDFEREC